MNMAHLTFIVSNIRYMHSSHVLSSLQFISHLFAHFKKTFDCIFLHTGDDNQTAFQMKWDHELLQHIIDHFLFHFYIRECLLLQLWLHFEHMVSLSCPQQLIFLLHGFIYFKKIHSFFALNTFFIVHYLALANTKFHLPLYCQKLSFPTPVAFLRLQ